MVRRLLTVFLAILTIAGAALGDPKVQKMPDPIPAENGMVVVSISVDNMPVEAAAQQARMLLSPGGVVFPDDRISRLVIKDFPENIEKIKAHLKHADVALPMVKLEVGFNASSSDRAAGGGVQGGAVVVNNKVIVNATGTAYNNSSGASSQGAMSVVTMSGSEGVISVGENVPYALQSFFFDYARGLNYVAPNVVFQNVSTGFGVVPRVLGGGEIMLKVYPRVSYQSPAGPGVVRYMDAATEVRVRNGQTVQIAGGSSDTRGAFSRILSFGRFSSGQGGSFTVTPTVMRDPYAK